MLCFVADHEGEAELESPLETLLKCVPSPRPNKSFSFAREPPDGCEKVKMAEEQRSVHVSGLKALEFWDISRLLWFIIGLNENYLGVKFSK